MAMQTDGLVWGFQLWLNLSPGQKMISTKHHDVVSARIPEV
jgi:redox-sensitive bicupin YhaK (pirin superfamily)